MLRLPTQQDTTGERTDIMRVELAHAIRQLEDRWRIGCILAAILPVRLTTYQP
jgi:hypothetical protein